MAKNRSSGKVQRRYARIMELVQKGFKTKQIAEQLRISTSTVRAAKRVTGAREQVLDEVQEFRLQQRNRPVGFQLGEDDD